MYIRSLTVLSILALAGCSDPAFREAFGLPPEAGSTVATPETPAPLSAAVAAPPPRPNARTADEFDTTTAEQRAAAVATPAAAGEARLGTTIASLGPPAQPGLWLLTGLVDAPVMGRVEYAPAGTSVTLELRPSGKGADAGSELSLAAMRLLEAPLTGLPEITVYRQ